HPPEVRALPRVTRSRLDPGLSSSEIDRAMADARRTGVAAVELDAALVARLRPDVIIGQAVCDVCAVGEAELGRLVTALMPTPWIVTLHAHTLDGVVPDVVLVALCGFDADRGRRDVAQVADRDARGVLGRRVEFLDGNAYTSRPGPRLVDAAEILARLIHG